MADVFTLQPMGGGTPIFSVDSDGNVTMTGDITLVDLTLTGNTIVGNATSDTITVTARVASDLVPSTDGARSLGSASLEWQDLFIDGTANIDSLVADTADVNGGTIDAATIGATTPAAATVTTLTSTTRIEAAPVELTIDTGAITVTQTLHQVDTEGDAASDDLSTISGGVSGQRLIIFAANGARSVVLKHGVDNIKCPGAADITLAEDTDVVELIKYGTAWVVISKATEA
jgi:hypothetical protein